MALPGSSGFSQAIILLGRDLPGFVPFPGLGSNVHFCIRDGGAAAVVEGAGWLPRPVETRASWRLASI